MELSIFYRYCGALGLVYLFFTLFVIRNRWKHRIGLGHGKNIEMTKAIRIHGNFNEYVPFLLMLMFFAISKGALTATWVHILAGALTLSRVSHFIGLVKSAGTSVFRAFGTSVIVLELIGLSIILLR